VLCDIEDMVEYTPTSVAEIAEWAAIFNAAEENGASYCKALNVNPISCALYGTYVVILN
jgi:hypothetical protein